MRGGDARPAARGRGPKGRSYAVTIMAAVTRRPPAVCPFLRTAPGPESRRAGGSEEARPRLPSPRPDPRCPVTWLRRRPAAPRRCGRDCPAVRLRRRPSRPQPPDLPAARLPRPRCHGNRAARTAPDVAGAQEPGRPCACAGKPEGRPAARPEGRGSEPRGAEAPGTRLTVPGVRPPPSLVEAPRQACAPVTEQDAAVY